MGLAALIGVAVIVLVIAELATRSGTGERFIVEFESGKPSCQLEKALVVARTVGLEVGDLKTAQPSPAAAEEDDLGFLPTFGDGQ
ncbi:transcriptional regulator [Rhizobium sullae]|nr:transcriptional regulator [Rhizobium sullae]